MEFVRETLGTPTPKVYAWSSKAHENTIGAEYIVMEKVAGVQLDSVWAGMGIQDRFTVAKAIARYLEAWTSCSFKQLGSLYYAKDLHGDRKGSLYTDCHGAAISNPRFAIGPSTGREFSDDGRMTVESDTGSSLEEYQSAIGHGEIACVQGLTRLPKSPVTFCGLGTYRPTREKKLKAIQCYLKMMKYLLPTDQSSQSSCLWHDDLHFENIFVNSENPTKVVGIIDWQPPTAGLERPRLPPNLAQLDPAAQTQAKALYMNSSLSALYKTFLHRYNLPFYNALVFHDTSSSDPLLLARNLLVDGEATYLAQVVELEKTCAELPGVRTRGSAPYPFQFSDEERADIEADVNGALRGMEAICEIQKTLGDLFPEQGIVPEERYAETRDALQQVKEQIIEYFARDKRERNIWREEWPFDD